jgi:wyosine [tRNA(Phe)-imidazoG37] synthetase (radical SAM superfamily)
MYQHLFGPVPSRRLGMSLGVDLIPHKVCTLNCIYCECGATTRMTLERAEYVPFEKVISELKDYFETHPDPDTITFSGSGEPTLHKRIGEVLAFLKELRPGVPVAVITNGTLLSDPAVRKELIRADVMLPSLDAATEEAFRKINRPLKNFQLKAYVEGLVQFRREYIGQIWLEVLILPAYNDDEENLAALKKAIDSIRPDRVQLNTLDRPGVIEDLRPASGEELERIRKILGPGAGTEIEIIAKISGKQTPAGHRTDVEEAILDTISRRPCTLEDIRQILDIHTHEINKYLRLLESSGRIETRRQERGVFYQLKKS